MKGTDLFINNKSALTELISEISGEPIISLDTEFMREKTYWPRLCLIQLANKNEVAAIDTLAEGLDLSPLISLLLDSQILKVFHSALKIHFWLKIDIHLLTQQFQMKILLSLLI